MEKVAIRWSVCQFLVLRGRVREKQTDAVNNDWTTDFQDKDTEAAETSKEVALEPHNLTRLSWDLIDHCRRRLSWRN